MAKLIQKGLALAMKAKKKKQRKRDKKESSKPRHRTPTRSRSPVEKARESRSVDPVASGSRPIQAISVRRDIVSDNPSDALANYLPPKPKSSLPAPVPSSSGQQALFAAYAGENTRRILPENDNPVFQRALAQAGNPGEREPSLEERQKKALAALSKGFSSLPSVQEQKKQEREQMAYLTAYPLPNAQNQPHVQEPLSEFDRQYAALTGDSALSSVTYPHFFGSNDASPSQAQRPSTIRRTRSTEDRTALGYHMLSSNAINEMNEEEQREIYRSCITVYGMKESRKQGSRKDIEDFVEILRDKIGFKIDASEILKSRRGRDYRDVEFWFASAEPVDELMRRRSDLIFEARLRMDRKLSTGQLEALNAMQREAKERTDEELGEYRYFVYGPRAEPKLMRKREGSPNDRAVEVPSGIRGGRAAAGRNPSPPPRSPQPSGEPAEELIKRGEYHNLQQRDLDQMTDADQRRIFMRCVIVGGLKENPARSTREDIDNFIRALRDVAGINIYTSEIVKAKRIGVDRDKQSNPRDLELWFTDEETVEQVLRARTDLVSLRRLKVDRKLSTQQAETLENLYHEARSKTHESADYKYYVYGAKDKPVLKRELKKKRRR